MMDVSAVGRILEDYRARGYYPSAVCQVFDETHTLYRGAFGDVTEDTWFDLASVSKIICTTMLLATMDEGRLAPEDRVLDRLPAGLPGPVTLRRLADVTILQLMTHTSGIVPWYPFYADGRDFYTVLEHVLSTTPVEHGMAYSDLNFMLLGLIFSHVTGLTLQEGLEHYIKEPMSISELSYGPVAPGLCAPSCYGNQIEQRMCAERGLHFQGWRPDGAVVRGFNPTMGFERTQNMHLNSSCDFYFHSPEVKSDFMSTYESRLKPGQCVKREMAYHCADVYQMYCHVITQVLPKDAAGLIERVRAILSERYGKDFLPVLDSYSGTDFEQI